MNDSRNPKRVQDINVHYKSGDIETARKCRKMRKFRRKPISDRFKSPGIAVHADWYRLRRDAETGARRCLATGSSDPYKTTG